jgi:hypothetical protein
MSIRAICLGLILALPMGCSKPQDPALSSDTFSFVGGNLPAMRWDHRPEAAEWTRTTLAAIAAEDVRLADNVPDDIAQWCPAYEKAGIAQRRVFWAGLFSALAKHESTWNPAASGGGGRWIGLLQIAPATARQYDCGATSSAALKNGAANLQCAVEIASRQVARDDLVSGGGSYGIGRDWAPLRSSSKRADMMAYTRSQSYCKS